MLPFPKFLRQIGRNLAEARAQQGLKQVDVSMMSGVSYRHYQNIEAGKVNITLETLYRLAKVYRMPVCELTKDE